MTLNEHDFPVREEAWSHLTGTWAETDNWLIREFVLGGTDFDEVDENFAMQFIQSQPNRENYLSECLSHFVEDSFKTWLIKSADRDVRSGDYPYVQAIRKRSRFFVEFSSNKFLTKKMTEQQTKAILAGGWHEPKEGKSPNYWREFEVDLPGLAAVEVFKVMRAAFIPDDPEVFNIRWFALRSNDGEYLCLYRAKFDGTFMRDSAVWNQTNSAWMPTETIHKWLYFGDTNIDEIERAEAEARFRGADLDAN